MAVAHPDKETTKKVEIRSGVIKNVLAENTDLESLVYSKVSETPRDNTWRTKKRRPRLRSWVKKIKGKEKNK